MTAPAAPLSDVTGALLVGGKSHRMGADKALLKVGGRPLVVIMKELLAGLFESTLVVGHPRPGFDDLGITVVEDIVPGSGAIGGVYTALHASRTPYTFVLACDMPNLTRAVIRRILAERTGADAVIPMGPRGAEPLCAVYSRPCEGAFYAGILNGNLRIRENLRDLNVVYPGIRTAAGGKDPFLNLNYPEDLAGL